MSDATEATILVVEDNRDLALGLRVNLAEQGYRVIVAHSVSEGLVAFRRAAPDLLILDLSLPDGDGLAMARRIRVENSDVLILMLTARSHRDAKLAGLRTGADDYVTKPFDLEELLARIDALLRRRRRSEAPTPESRAPMSDVMSGCITIGDIEMDFDARTLRRAKTELPISRIGFELLGCLVMRRGSVVQRAELLERVWGYDPDVATRTLDTHVFELRRLLEPDPSAPRYIKTVRGVGYRIDF